MAKAIAQIKLQIPGGAAISLPQWVIILVSIKLISWSFVSNLMLRRQVKKGETVPVIITIYTDKTFSFVLKTPPLQN